MEGRWRKTNTPHTHNESTVPEHLSFEVQSVNGTPTMAAIDFGDYLEFLPPIFAGIASDKRVRKMVILHCLCGENYYAEERHVGRHIRMHKMWSHSGSIGQPLRFALARGATSCPSSDDERSVATRRDLQKSLRRHSSRAVS